MDSVSCTSQSVSMQHWLSHRLVCSDNFLLVTWGKGSASKYISFPFGFWSPFCTLCSWSLTSSITTALGEADSTHIIHIFLLFLVREQMAQRQHILQWAGRWKFTYLTLNYPPDIPIPVGTAFNILNMYHLCSLIVRLSRSVSSWWKHLLSKVYEFWKALKNSDCILSFCQLLW